MLTEVLFKTNLRLLQKSNQTRQFHNRAKNLVRESSMARKILFLVAHPLLIIKLQNDAYSVFEKEPLYVQYLACFIRTKESTTRFFCQALAIISGQ